MEVDEGHDGANPDARAELFATRISPALVDATSPRRQKPTLVHLVAIGSSATPGNRSRSAEDATTRLR
jgi:hypothetical protein